MNRKQRILKKLNIHISYFDFNIIDNSNLHSGHNNFDGTGETHLQLNLTLNKQKKINRLEIHRKINELIKEEFDKGLHSMQIKIK